MKYLKLKCNQNQVGPKEVEITIPGTNKVVKIWIVSGDGVEVEYDAKGKEIELGIAGSKIGIGVSPKYRSLTCEGSEGDIVWGIEEIEEL